MRSIMSVLMVLAGVALVPAQAARAQVVATASYERGPRFLLARDSKVVPVDVIKTPVLARRLNLDLEGATLKDALTEIESQSGLRLAYSDDAIPLDKRVYLRAEAITAAAALTDVLFDAGVDVVFKPDGSVALVKRPPAPPTGSIVGRVTNAQSGEALEGAEIHLQGTKWRTLTRTEGQYSLAGVDTGSYTVTARRIGYTRQSRSVTVAEGQEVTADFALQPAPARLGDVVVTAQKREERLQDVPLSVAVVTAAEIDQRGLLSAEDYLRGIPGVNQVNSGSNGQNIIIRGLEAQLGASNFAGSGSAVATYFGETPTTSSAGLGGNTSIDTKLMDIERVEVLRGPQGTAFGSASMSGTVRTIPVAPKLDRLEGSLRAGYSSTARLGGNNYHGQAVGNLPLFKGKLALRAVGGRYEESGYYRNVAGADPAYQAGAAAFGAQAFATNADNVGARTTTGGRVAALVQASDALRVTLSYLKQRTELDGTSLANLDGYGQRVLQVAPEHVIRGQTGGVQDSDLGLANAMVEYDLGWASLLATYSHLKSWWRAAVSSQGGPPLPLSIAWTTPHREHIGELRLATRLDGAWNFLAGLYAEDIEDEERDEAYWFGSPDSNFFAPGQRFLGTAHTQQQRKQKAAFAEASWQFLPGVTLTGGVRVYDYDRTLLRVGGGGIFGTAVQDVATEATGTGFRGNLSYKPTENALVYATWAQGFRLGRPQAGLISGVCDVDNNGLVDGTNTTIESTQHIESDEVDNYELGGKFTLLDRRLIIAADVYRMDWTQMPFTVGLTCGGVVRLYTANAGAARSEGLEFQANFYVTEAFRVDLGGSYVNARLTTDVPAQNLSKGQRLPGAPEVTANLGLQYGFELGGSRAFVRADPIYVGPFRGTGIANPVMGAGGYMKVDASARVALRRTTLDLFVRNLTNADDFTWGGSSPMAPFFGARPRPRTIGLQLSRTF